MKRYAAHYQIPSETCVVVPIKKVGDEFSCDVRWEDANGELQQKTDVLFIAENIEPLNEFVDSSLHDLWKHYYADKV